MAYRWSSAPKPAAEAQLDGAKREGETAPIDPELADLREALAKQVQATRIVLEQGRQLKERRDPQGRRRISRVSPAK